MFNKTTYNRTVTTISTIRRAKNVNDVARRVGIIVNDDGTVFDKITHKRFDTITEWFRDEA